MAVQLFCQVLQFEFMEFSYSADLAGIKFSISEAPDGYLISFKGYNQKIKNFIQSWCRKLANLKIQESNFKVVRDQLLDYYENFELEEPRFIVSQTREKSLYLKSIVDNVAELCP